MAEGLDYLQPYAADSKESTLLKAVENGFDEYSPHQGNAAEYYQP